MAALDDRLNDGEYRDWIKTVLCFQFVRDGLVKFADQRSQQLHQTVLYNLQHLGKPVATKLCADISFDVKKKSTVCTCGHCNDFLIELKTHANKQLNLSNSDPLQLLCEHWQSAKLFMNNGQDLANTDPDKTDISGLLNFITNCKEAADCIDNIQKVIKVRENRNTTIHTFCMKIQPADFQNIIQSMLDLLEDRGNPAISPVCLMDDPQAQDAVAKIKEVQAASFVITKDDEIKAFKDLRDEIQNNVKCISSEIKEVSELLNDTKQTKEAMKEMHEKMHGKEEEVKKFQTTVEWMEATLKAYNDQPDLHPLVSSLEQSVETGKKEIRKIKKQLKTGKTEMESLRKEQKVMKTKQQMDTQQLEDNTNKIQGQEQQIEGIKFDVDNIKQGVQEQEHQIKGIKSDVENIKQVVQEQEKKPTEAELNRLAAHLKEGYAENDKFYIPLLPGCTKIRVGEIFAPVILTKNDAGKEQPLSSYKTMLCKEVPKQQLFLVGEAGAGKSTFCKHLIDVWRSGSTTSQFDNPEELRKFKFVFHVSCRFAKETDSVLDMICEQLCYDESKKKIAIHVLSHSPEACFIIMDGLDEWQSHPGKSTGLLGDTTGLPSRKGVEGCLILITSRPWRLQALGKEIEPKARFELNGLQSPEQLIEKILSKLEYPDTAILCNNFLCDVRTCGMDEMIKTPLILIIVLSIWEQSSDSEQNKSLHPSLCRNYMNMIESLILRTDDKHHWTGDERRLMEPLVNNPEYWKTKWEEKSVCLPSCCQELKSFRTFSGLILSLSQLAFNLLFGESTSDEQKLVFSKQDCKKYLSDEELNVCLGIGILAKSQTSRGIRKMEKYSFPHKTVQEFLSALWLAGPGADRAGRITERIREETGSLSLYDAVDNVEMLLKFLSGLGPQVAAGPLQYIYTQGIQYSRTSHINQLILSCCAESQHCNNTKHIYFTFPKIWLFDETMSDDDLRMWANIVEASSSCLRLLNIRHLTLQHESVEEPSDISSCSIDTLYQSLSCCGNLEELWLWNISCSDDRHVNISSVLDLHNLHKLEELTLRWLSVPTVLWPQVTNSCLRYLDITHCNNISPVLDLQNLHKLEELTLWGLSVRTVLWPQVTNSCLRRLDIVGLTLQHESVEEPADISSCHSSIDTLYQSLSCCGNLEYLWLYNISCSDDRHDNISSVLDIHNLHKLEELELWNLSVRTVLWPPVTISGLRRLYINHLKLTHEGVEELCRTYEQCRQLERVYCEVRRIFCVDHRTHCKYFEDLQKHIMLVNLPYFDDDDNDDVE